MKKRLKIIVANILGWQVRRLRKNNEIKVVSVAGSVGKTSTKITIASVLSKSLRVRFQDGNYNDIVSVPLIFFGQNMPSLYNPIAWIGIFIGNEIQIHKPYNYDVVVVETGTDGPGQLSKFSKYLSADIGVLTSISPEHMEYFATLDKVANEELYIFSLASKVIVNTDLVNPMYLKGREYIGYSLISDKNLFFGKITDKKLVIYKDSKELFASDLAASRSENYSQIASVVVANLLGLDVEKIIEGLTNIRPINGRMNKLEGLNGSLIIDDSYNASPEATKAALDYLYGLNLNHKIALLGNMNELGAMSESAHREIGRYCNSEKLDLVITIGEDANKYTSLEAKNNGCNVEQCESPYQAGKIIEKLLNKDTAVLIKGSQNGVFAEESIKSILANKEDESKLVRQSRHWLKIKQKQFKDYSG